MISRLNVNRYRGTGLVCEPEEAVPSSGMFSSGGGGGRGGGLVPVHCNLEEEPIGFVPHPFITVFSMHQ